MPIFALRNEIQIVFWFTFESFVTVFVVGAVLSGSQPLILNGFFVPLNSIRSVESHPLNLFFEFRKCSEFAQRIVNP